MLAVRRRNWATAISTPAAMSLSSLMYIEVTARKTAAQKLAVASAFSNLLVEVITFEDKEGAGANPYPIPTYIYRKQPVG